MEKSEKTSIKQLATDVKPQEAKQVKNLIQDRLNEINKNSKEIQELLTRIRFVQIAMCLGLTSLRIRPRRTPKEPKVKGAKHDFDWIAEEEEDIDDDIKHEKSKFPS